jgi:aminomethyltransferase
MSIGSRRKAEGGFYGSDVILSQLKKRPERRRIGVIYSQGPPARHGAAVLDSDMTDIGTVTSGCPSPTIGKNIAMAYVDRSYSKNGTMVNIQVRKKSFSAKVVKMPFVPTSYYILVK